MANMLIALTYYLCDPTIRGYFMELEIVKIINLDKKYEDKKGKQHACVNYYLVIGNTYVAIRPAFSKGYTQLDLVARVVKNGSTRK